MTSSYLAQPLISAQNNSFAGDLVTNLGAASLLFAGSGVGLWALTYAYQTPANAVNLAPSSPAPVQPERAALEVNSLSVSANLSALEVFAPEAAPAPGPGTLTTNPDPNALAKRVALTLSEHPEASRIDTVWVAQLSNTVVLKGQVSDQATLDQLVEIARGVRGAATVDATQVQVP